MAVPDGVPRGASSKNQYFYLKQIPSFFPFRNDHWFSRITELTPFILGTPAGRLMAGVLASVAAYETEVRKERQLAGIAKAKAEGKTWGGRRPGTRIKLTEEKEMLIHQLHAEGKPVAAIARMVGLTRKTMYRALGGAGDAA
jgi:hypothetical protein